MATISYQPWYVGQTYPTWDIPLRTDGGNEDLTGVAASDFTLIFRNTAVAPPVDVVGTGAFTIKVVNPGEVLYKPSLADVSAVFNGSIIIKCTFAPSFGVADEAIYDPIPFQITID